MQDLLALSGAAASVWAKSPNPSGSWLPLWRHMDDAGDVAGELFGQWTSPHVRSLLSQDLNGKRSDALAVVQFLAAAHDIGKASPAFAIQNDALAEGMRQKGLYLPDQLAERHLVHHTLASHHTLCRWLVKKHGFTGPVARTWGAVLSAHHGAPPDVTTEQHVTPLSHPQLFGQFRWEEVQDELLDRAAERLTLGDRLLGLSSTRLSQSFQVLCTALVILSDWIASNEELFDYRCSDPGDGAGHGDGRVRVEQALALLDLPGPWRAEPASGDADSALASRFSLPVGSGARPVQKVALEAARAMNGPGLLVIEAPMGEGKTEAALLAAEELAAREGLGGLFVALPTQATTNAMFDRVVAWLDTQTDGRSRSVASAMTLAHGKARLNRQFRAMMRIGNLRDVDAASDTSRKRSATYAHSWLNGRKKASLATFVIGTIDQLLFAGLKARHLMLRHLGLADKVIIIDEAHAYDVYMNTYLTRVLTWLGVYGVPVIVLSATLPAKRRAELLAAYHAWSADDERLAASTSDIGYPAVVASSDTGVDVREAPERPRELTVAVDVLDDDLTSLVEMCGALLDEGGVALVVRNTVRRAIAAAAALTEHFGPDHVSLFHSRYLAADRARNDEWLLDRFGSPTHLEVRGSTRPRRHVVVATQVVEQSLDVDFDVLFTDLAPVDLVLQRLGRVHRHVRGASQSERPERVRLARCFLTGVDEAVTPPDPDSGSVRVYGRYPLYRAAAALWPSRGAHIELPSDIARLVQLAYSDEVTGPDEWQQVMSEARSAWEADNAKRQSRAEAFQVAPPRGSKPILGWVAAGAGETDDEAQGQGQVRDGAPSLEAFVVVRHADGRWTTPPWLPDGGDLEVPHREVPSRAVAEAVASCSLRLPLNFSNQAAEKELWDATPEPWEGSPLLYRVPVLTIDEDGWGDIGGRRVCYTPSRGLEVFDADD